MNWKLGVVFTAGVLIGTAATWLLLSSKKHVERYELTRDLDLQQSYFFDPKAQAPVRGVMKAGSQFEVEWRYSRANYLVFRTVVDRDQLTAMARRVAASQPATGAQWSRPKKSEERSESTGSGLRSSVLATNR